MPWSGGVYTRGYPSWTSDANNNLPISATKFDTEDNDFAAGLNNCITKDGLSQPTSAMNWNGQNLTNVAQFATTGSISLVGGKVTVGSAGNVSMNAPTSGVTVAMVNGVAGTEILTLNNSAGDARMGIYSQGTEYGLIEAQTNQFTLTAIGASTPLQLSVSGGGGNCFQCTPAGAVQATDDGGTMQTLGWRDMPTVVTTTNRTTVMADRGKVILANAASLTMTIAANASVPYPTGTVLTFYAGANSACTIAINGGDTLQITGTSTTGTRTLAANGIATAIKLGGTQWFISGPGLS